MTIDDSSSAATPKAMTREFGLISAITRSNAALSRVAMFSRMMPGVSCPNAEINEVKWVRLS